MMLYLTAALALIATACKKEKVDPLKPTITWESNAGFGQVEMTDALDAVVIVKAPGKFQDVKLVLNLGANNNLVNQFIDEKHSNNKSKSGSNPILDLVEDTSSANLLGGLGMRVGNSLRGREELQLDLKKILDRILKGQPVENNSAFTIEIRATDQSGNSESKTARFHFTSAPEFYWAKNVAFDEVDLDNPIEAKVEIRAWGKIDALTVKLEDGADEFLTDRIKSRTTSGTTLMDLINDEKVSKGIKTFPAPSSISGKDQTTLDFSFIYDFVPDIGTSLSVFTIAVTDKNGKKSEVQVKFRKN